MDNNSIDYSIAINQIIVFLEKQSEKYLQEAKNLALVSIERSISHLEDIDKYAIIHLKNQSKLIDNLVEEIKHIFKEVNKNGN